MTRSLVGKLLLLVALAATCLFSTALLLIDLQWTWADNARRLAAIGLLVMLCWRVFQGELWALMLLSYGLLALVSLSIFLLLASLGVGHADWWLALMIGATATLCWLLLQREALCQSLTGRQRTPERARLR